MSSLTISARTFRALMDPILPSAGTDVMLPVLTGVLVETSGPWLIATATNRFQVAKKRIPAPEGEKWPEFRALISTRSIRNIFATFKPSRGSDPELTFEVIDDELAVSVGGGLVDDVAAARATYYLLRGEFPKTDTIFAKALAAEPSDQPQHFNWKYLAAFALADSLGSGLQIKFTGAAAPLLVTGDNFLGAIMPKRVVAGDLSTDWTGIFAPAEEVAA